MGERASVLARNARDSGSSPGCWQQERSQMYFAVKAIRYVTGRRRDGGRDGNRYGGIGPQGDRARRSSS